MPHLAGGAANAALMLASAGLASAYAGKGVRVNAVNPGLTLTERLHEGMQAEARHLGISIEEALTRAKATRLLGRIAEPREIAEAVVYLASAWASYVTGRCWRWTERLRRWWCRQYIDTEICTIAT